jgi:hypothetical protein
VILYKFKKIFKENKYKLIYDSFIMSLVLSIFSLVFIFFMGSNEFNKREKLQMISFSVLFTSLNFFTISLVYNIKFNIIYTIMLGYFINFVIFIIPSLLYLIWCEFSDVKLDKDEERDAKLGSLLKRRF